MVYVTEGIILEKTELRDTEKSYLVLTKEYGKIRWFFKESSKQTPCDIGTVVEIHLDRKNDVNRIKSCRQKRSFRISGTTFENIHSFLIILAFCKRNIPEGWGDGIFYQELSYLIYRSWEADLHHLLFLSELRFLSLFHDWPERNLNPTLEKLKDLSARHRISDLEKILGIPEDSYQIVHSLFLQSIEWQNSFS